ncbi:pyrroline-5-carboxylate reductase family protein [Pseudooceanicola sp. C21-150M6]|uniref:pyrroline-5-carboxylate reductase family protein n=1 Tax=Pseudooceanicola sp. C21-150M6 TaxID=3434355 RepID=UPI003D7FD25A
MKLGIVGGSGQLGRAIAFAHLRNGGVAAGDLWIANRDGRRDGFEDFPDVTVTSSAQALAETCDVVLLSVPPAQFGALELRAEGKLVISVMAGVTIAAISEKTGTGRIARGMSSPVAELGLAHSSFCATTAVTEADRAMIRAVFAPCGMVDEVTEEPLMDVFCALTGPVPGFVAYYAACMVEAAVAQGMPEDVADRAVRQLFQASGAALKEWPETPAAQVQAMVDYAGTTAAGLLAMMERPVAEGIAAGLEAAKEKARVMGSHTDLS